MINAIIDICEEFKKFGDSDYDFLTQPLINRTDDIMWGQRLKSISDYRKN